ncbi:MAG TPA: universal stress protein [Magnetospirillaceae bacterium]|jgi:nucleotide-binding universal stress UspA family protein
MTYRVILTCLTDIESAPATLDLGMRVAKQFGTEPEVMHVRADPASAVPLVGEGMSGAMVEEMLGAAEKHGLELSQALRAKFDEACQKHGSTAGWREEIGREDDVVASAGRLSDLVILARPLPNRDLPSPLTVNAAILDTGRPLLLVPAKPPAAVASNIAVFWNGSPQAARAVHFALPFLKKAARVSVLAAREEETPTPGEGLVAYLAKHDVTASFRTFVAGGPGGDVGRGLLTEAEKEGCDLVVMGAFTHSRLRQLILGGVTRAVLNSATLPVLLCR